MNSTNDKHRRIIPYHLFTRQASDESNFDSIGILSAASNRTQSKMGSIPQRDCRRFTRRFLKSADLKVKRTIAKNGWRLIKARQKYNVAKPDRKKLRIVHLSFVRSQR